MNVGAIRRIILTIKAEIEKIAHIRSKQLIQNIERLFDGLPDEDDVNKALGDQVKNIIETFWREQSQMPIAEDWDNNEVISTWLRLQNALHETKWDIQKTHHAYFYHCLQFQYNQAGDGIINLDKLMPILISLCRRIGYAEKDGLGQYPSSSLQIKMRGIEQEKRTHLIEGFSFIATSFTMMFYLLYHHCSKTQLELLPSLIIYRVNTTDEEIRSETAMVETMLKTPDKVLTLLEKMKVYIDGRPLLIDNFLAALPESFPKSKKNLLSATIGQRVDYLDLTTDTGKRLNCLDAALRKRLYFGIIHSILSKKQEQLCDSFVTVLEQEFALRTDQSYREAINFAMAVNAQFPDLSQTIKEQLFSASYIFSLGRYIKLCESNPNPNPYLWFSHETKSSAAKKLQLQEKGEPSHMGLKEWAATHEGRLNLLKSQFEEYKEELLQTPHNALIA